MDARYEAYPIPETVIEYPRQDFLDTVMNLQEKGDVSLFSDQPEATFYVVALAERYQPSIAEFYADTTAPGFQGSSLLQRFESEKRKQYREEVMTALRQQARATITDDPNVLKSLEERSDQSE